MSERLTREWMEQLGIEDGSAVARHVLEQIELDRSKSTEQLCQGTVAAVRECASLYRERGVSDALLTAWHAACLAEISRRFAEYRSRNRNGGGHSAQGEYQGDGERDGRHADEVGGTTDSPDSVGRDERAPDWTS